MNERAFERRGHGGMRGARKRTGGQEKKGQGRKEGRGQQRQQANGVAFAHRVEDTRSNGSREAFQAHAPHKQQQERTAVATASSSSGYIARTFFVGGIVFSHARPQGCHAARPQNRTRIR